MLQEHFGKRGVQTLIYRIALSQLERSAARYAGLLSAGRLQLGLDFDEAARSICKRVRVRREDGSLAERSVSQLSGGEWRRLGLALSLAFADFAKQRAGLGCNLLVLDEVMQHMDAEGQAAMAQLLGSLGIDSTLVIAHGLASDSLYGAFDAIDVVEKRGDASAVRLSVGSGADGVASAPSYPARASSSSASALAPARLASPAAAPPSASESQTESSAEIAAEKALRQRTVPQLKAEARRLGLRLGGTKSELVARILGSGD